MRSIPLTLAVAVLVMFGLAQARADSINLSTGLYANGSVIGSGDVADAHWTQSGNTLGVNAGAALTTFPDNADYYPAGYWGGWVPEGPSSSYPDSDWIAADPLNANDNGVGTYSRTFSLTGYNLSTVSLTGSWTLDDGGILLLNGTQIGGFIDGDWGTLVPVSVPTGSPLFQQGSNTLQIIINSTDNYLEGVRFQGSVSGSLASAVPEPTTIVGLFGVGLMGALACLWRFGRSWVASVPVA